ncbi:MAG: peptide deformylase [Ignavibacteriaceae bacterium]|nr:peptide deformylase [Ignavibacteriaceae bacterium]
MKYLITLFAIIFLSGCACIQKVSKDSQFSSKQTELVMSADSTTPMRVLSVYNKRDSLLLRTKCEDIVPDSVNTILQNLLKRMYRTVNDSLSKGVGIAAPQVGILKNIIWVQRYDKPSNPFEVYFNPIIIQYTKKKLSWVEGCLSIPGRKDTTTTRSYAILVDYMKPDKSHKIEMVEGFTAIIFQHEIDHLNGIIYLDRL